MWLRSCRFVCDLFSFFCLIASSNSYRFVEQIFPVKEKPLGRAVCGKSCSNSMEQSAPIQLMLNLAVRNQEIVSVMRGPCFELLLEKLQIVNVHVRNSPIIKVRVRPLQKLVSLARYSFRTFCFVRCCRPNKKVDKVFAPSVKPTPPQVCYPNNPGSGLINSQRQLFKKSLPIRL